MSKYKECGFRDKVKVCKFKEEDCNPDECDMFNIEFNTKSILKQARKERKDIVELTKQMKEMKKCGDHKVFKDKYDGIKSLRNDKVQGMWKLSQSVMYLKRRGKK